MKIAWYLVAGVVFLAGSVFLLQGLRFLPSRLMYGKPEWVVIGAIMVVAGAAVAVVVNRREARR
jgi:hypothetical protein